MLNPNEIPTVSQQHSIVKVVFDLFVRFHYFFFFLVFYIE